MEIIIVLLIIILYWITSSLIVILNFKCKYFFTNRFYILNKNLIETFNIISNITLLKLFNKLTTLINMSSASPPVASIIVGCADRSGSMMSYGQSGVAGQFYEQMKLLWKTANDNNIPTYFTLVTFDDKMEVFIEYCRLDGVDEEDLPSITNFNGALSPRGCTRLYDSAIESLELLIRQKTQYMKTLPILVKRLDPVIATSFVLLTDGMDNASESFSSDILREKMKKLKKEPSFTSIFLGANINASDAGAQMGFSKETTVQMGISCDSASQCLRAVSNSLARATTGDNTQINIPSPTTSPTTQQGFASSPPIMPPPLQLRRY